MENKEIEHESCECCHCKKIFMLLVLMLLSFMAGIMVGDCGYTHHQAELYHYHPQFTKSAQHMIKKQHHRGATPETTQQNPTSANNEMGGFIIEVE